MAQLLPGRVDCLGCGETLDGAWPADGDSPEDIEDVDPVPLTCPACALRAEYDYPGWQYRTEAG